MSLPPVSPISSINSTAALDAARAGSKPAGSSNNLFARVLQGANQQQLAAEQATQDLATGKTDSVQHTVLSAAKADLSFRLVLEIRNKLIDAYQEVMRMQV